MKFRLLSFVAIVMLLSVYGSPVLAQNQTLTNSYGSITWPLPPTGTPQAVNLHPVNLADVRVTVSATVNNGTAAAYGIVSFAIGTDNQDGTFNQIAAYSKMLPAGTSNGNVTNDFKDMPRGIQYRVKASIIFYNMQQQ